MKRNGFRSLQKNINQIEILKIEILCKDFIKLVVAEKDFKLSLYFRVVKAKIIEFQPKFEKIRKITAISALVDLLTKWR